jgi:hypothetical protein
MKQMDTIDLSYRSSPPVFVTDHLALASYLLSRGHEPTLSASSSGKFLFKFAPSEDLTQRVEAFNNGDATVEPTAYDAARIWLRRQMDALKGSAQ